MLGSIQLPTIICILDKRKVYLLNINDVITILFLEKNRNRDPLIRPEDIPKVTPPYLLLPQEGQREHGHSDSTPVVKIKLSHGAYAGIGCAAALLLIIVTFTIVAVRKR